MTARILVTTGPESSGKTTLARDLRKHLGVPLVTEASRDYLTALYAGRSGAVYQQDDLLAIARLQLQREKDALALGPACLVCDTDLLVIVVWSEVKYGGCDPALLDLFRESLHLAPRHYLLCDHGIPWESDPLREHPHARDMLALHYLNQLQRFDLRRTRVSGTPHERLHLALAATVSAPR